MGTGGSPRRELNKLLDYPSGNYQQNAMLDYEQTWAITTFVDELLELGQVDILEEG
jgi:hypothetical protein